MRSNPPKRSITPYAAFEESPPATESAPAPRPSSRPPKDFTQELREELERVEQSITENVKRTLQALGTRARVTGTKNALSSSVKIKLDVFVPTYVP